MLIEGLLEHRSDEVRRDAFSFYIELADPPEVLGAARQAVRSADLPLTKAVELLSEAETLADLFRLAERAAVKELGTHSLSS